MCIDETNHFDSIFFIPVLSLLMIKIQVKCIIGTADLADKQLTDSRVYIFVFRLNRNFYRLYKIQLISKALFTLGY